MTRSQTAGTQTDPDFVFASRGRRATGPCRRCPEPPARAARTAGRAARHLEGPRLQHDLAPASRWRSGPLPRAQPDHRDACLHQDQRPDPQPRAADARHRACSASPTCSRSRRPSSGAGLHIEPGIWAHVPPTTNPSEPPTVVRMASIPHGTVILAQGTTQFLNGGPPPHPGQQHHSVPDRHARRRPTRTSAPGEQEFPELNLAITTTVPQPLARRHPGDGQEPQQRDSERAARTDDQEPDVHPDLDHAQPDPGRRYRQHGIPGRRGQPARRQRQAARSTPRSGSRPSPGPAARTTPQLQYTQLVSSTSTACAGHT